MSATESAPATCPACGHGLTTTPAAVPRTGGRVLFHTPNGAAVVRRLKTDQDRTTDKITAFAGSLSFVYIHAAWFGIWIVLNAGALGASLVFDAFPFGLLTLIVSLEAIFLSTFVMVSQNRQSARSDLQAELDFETNLRSEIWTLHIGQKLGLDPTEIEHHVRDAIDASNTALASSSTDATPSARPPAVVNSSSRTAT